MLFGQCPNRGGDLLKGASLTHLITFLLLSGFGFIIAVTNVDTDEAVVFITCQYICATRVNCYIGLTRIH